MPCDRLDQALSRELAELREMGTLKGAESVVTRVVPADGERGPRFELAGDTQQQYLRMNSNSYLGLSLRQELVEAEEVAARRFGTGPGAVRFISGTYQAHVDLEARLAAYHDRQAGMVFSSAYATTMGVLPALITSDTVVISDALNHNCIINAMRLARPGGEGSLRPRRSGRPGQEAGFCGWQPPSCLGGDRRHIQYAG